MGEGICVGRDARTGVDEVCALNALERRLLDARAMPATPTKLDFLRLQVAPLLRFAADVDVAAETFTHKVERLKLQILQATPAPQLLQSIAEDVSLLPDIAELVRSSPSAALAHSADLATATPAQLTQIIRDLAPQMKNRREHPSAFLNILRLTPMTWPPFATMTACAGCSPLYHCPRQM